LDGVEIVGESCFIPFHLCSLAAQPQLTSRTLA
jgi:hypothetical protein